MRLVFLAALAALLPFSASARPFMVDAAASHLRFSGTHAGNPFTGEFKTWTADIDFDAADLEKSSIKVSIDTASAKTGNAMYDGTLPSADWFNVSAFPAARFETTHITQNPDGTYRAEGILTIRDSSQPVGFTFALSPQDAGSPPVHASFSFAVSRLSFGVGAKSDPNCEWVGKEIQIEGKLVASPK